MDGPNDRSRSYRLEDLDASAELRRLASQVALLAPREFAFLRRVGVAPGDAILDLGCGPGFFAELLVQEVVPDGRVVGVDVDGAMVALANERCAAVENLSFLEGTGQRLPLDDDSVDAAYARFLFQHLTDPASVLAEMRRVVRPGGLVAVGDTDDGGLVVHPAPQGFAGFLDASRRAQEARGGDREVGRKLKSLLVDLGLDDVHATTEVMTSEDIGPKALLAIAVGFKAGVLGPPYAEPGEIQRVQDELDALSQQPGFYGHALGYLAWGRVP